MARVWDEFLTSRDRELMEAGWAKTRPFGLGVRPAVLVIDNYRGSLGDERLPILESIKRWPASCGFEGWAAIDKTKILLEGARRNGVPVFYSTNDLDAPPWTLEADTKRSNLDGAKDPRRFEIVDELKPQPGEVVIQKASASAFFCTSLITHMVNRQIDSVIVCGNSTSGCVRATTVDATAYRIRAAVVEDCTFDRTQASHAMSLYDLDAKYADVMALDDVLAYMASPAVSATRQAA